NFIIKSDWTELTNQLPSYFTPQNTSSMTDARKKVWTEKEVLETFGSDIASLTTEQIENRIRLLDNECRVFRNEKSRMLHEETTMNEKIKENLEKIKL